MKCLCLHSDKAHFCLCNKDVVGPRVICNDCAGVGRRMDIHVLRVRNSTTKKRFKERVLLVDGCLNLDCENSNETGNNLSSSHHEDSKMLSAAIADNNIKLFDEYDKRDKMQILVKPADLMKDLNTTHQHIEYFYTKAILKNLSLTDFNIYGTCMVTRYVMSKLSARLELKTSHHIELLKLLEDYIRKQIAPVTPKLKPTRARTRPSQCKKVRFIGPATVGPVVHGHIYPVLRLDAHGDYILGNTPRSQHNHNELGYSKQFFETVHESV
jgi:hypothetical protein